MRKLKHNFKKKTVAFMMALSLAVQPFAGTVFNTAIVAEAAAAEVVSIAKYDDKAKTTILKEEDGTFSIVLPRINGEVLSENGYEQYKDSFSILVKLEDDVDFSPIDEKLKNVRSEVALQAADDKVYYTQYWLNKEENWSGWGMKLKLSDEVAFVRFQSNAYEDIYLDYKLQEVGRIQTMEFKDLDGDDKIQIGIGQTVVINFDYLQLNDGKLGAGEYGYENFEWKALVGGTEKNLDDVFTWEQNYGWDSYPENGGYYFNPIKENITFRAIYKENPELYADYKVEILTGTKGPEYDPNNPYATGNTLDPGTNKEGYELIWYDEFDGQYGGDQVDPNTGLDLNKWSYQLGNGVTESGGDNNMAGWGNGERQSYTKEKKNIAVNENGKGLLRITAAYEDEGVAIEGEDKSFYSSGRIVTRGDDASNPLFNTTYGYVESRMALPETVGAWPAFWMLPQSTELYGAWPLSGEIDIMESCGNLKNQACATLHWGTPEHVYQGSGYVDLNSSFSHMHTYAVEWEPGKITFYYDGKKIYTQASWGIKSDLVAADSVTFDAPYDQPYYLLLNLALDSGNFGGKDNMTTFQDTINMYVDYVRVYQKKEGYDTTGIRRQVLDAKTDWKNVAGNKISQITATNIVEAEDGNVNALEIAGKDEKSKWYLAYTEGGAANVESFVKDDTEWAKVNVKNDGTQSYSVQMIGHYNAQAGYLYKVSFDAYAEGGLVGKTANADSKEYKGWSTYGSTSFVLADEPRSYSFFVDQKADFDDCRVEFNFGNLGEKMSEVISGSAYVGNVKVEIVDPEDIGRDLVRYPQPLVDGEIIYNGNFDQGVNHAGFWSAGEGTTFKVPDYTTESLLKSDIAIKDVAAGVTKYYERRAQVSAENEKPSIYQAGFALDKSKYTAVFDVYSEKTTTVNAAIYSVDIAEDGTQTLGNKLLESSTQNVAANKVVTYACDFEPLRALQNAAFVLTFGDGASVQVDNVSMLPANKARQVHPEIENGTAQDITKDVSSLIRINYIMHDNDAVNPDSNPFYFEKGEGTIQLAPATSPNAEFAGWSEKETVKYVEDYVTEVSTDRDGLTLHAHWGDRVTESKEPETIEEPEQPEDTTVAVTGVTLEPQTVTINKGEALQLTATVLPEDATNKNIKWTSDNQAAVFVDDTGRISALNATSEPVTITATTEDGNYTATCTVTVVIKVTGISFVINNCGVTVGNDIDLVPQIIPADATNQNIKWDTPDPTIARVENGKVTGLKEGTATIIAKTEDGGFEAKCTVTVSTTEVKVTGIMFADNKKSLLEGESGTLNPIVTPTTATNQNIEWHSSEPEIVKVINGVIIGLAAGTSVITAKTEDGEFEAYCTVTVTANTIKVTGVRIEPSTVTLEEGESKTLTAIIEPENATNQDIEWNTDHPASVGVSGGIIQATGIIPNEPVKITATTKDGNYVATCEVTVVKKVVPVTGISLKEPEIELIEGESRQLIATIEPEDATNKNVTWQLKNEADSECAKVDSEGNVTALKEGKATIVAVSEDGSYEAECIVTVKSNVVAVTGIHFEETEIELTEGESRQLVAIIEPEDATNKNITWHPQNPARAYVDAEGNVTALKEGKAIITAVSEDGSYEAECVVTVNAKPAEPIVQPPVENYIVTFDSNGGTPVDSQIVTQGGVAVSPQQPVRERYTFAGWTLNGNAYNFGTPVYGNIILTAQWNEIKATGVKITGKTKYIEVGTSAKIAVGKKVTLVATVSPVNVTNATVIWKSSNTKYATVNKNGVVTAKKAGKNKTVKITATTADGSNKKKTFKVKIMPKAVKKITLTAGAKTVKAGKKVTIKATVTPSDKKQVNTTLKWVSSNTKYATVSKKGVVKTKKAGKGKTVKITAYSTDGSNKKKTVKIKITK